MKKLHLFAFLFVFNTFNTTDAKPLTSIKIGWQVPWATQGQIVQILKHTKILEKNGLKAQFIGRTYGPLLNELALSGEVDVILTADQPAIVLFSKTSKWRSIGRLMYNRTLTYAPPKSNIHKISDLKGKKIGVPIGAAAERTTLMALRKANLAPNKDTKIVNLGIREQGPLIRKSNSEKWGPFDALGGFDPVPAIFQSKGLIRVLDVGKVVSMVLMSDELIKKKTDVAKKVMQSIFDAYDFYRQNKKQANTWFLQEAGLKGADQEACNIAAKIEPNVFVKKRSEISLNFADDDFRILRQAAKFLEPKIGKVDITKFVNNQFTEDLK